jgi:hypothetical protein
MEVNPFSGHFLENPKSAIFRLESSSLDCRYGKKKKGKQFSQHALYCLSLRERDDPATDSNHCTYQQQNILHFQVAVCHILGMTVLQGLKESDTCIASFLFIVARFENETIQELTTLDFFHDQEVVIRSLKRFVQSYNVRMIKLLHNGDFNMQ